MDYSSNDQFKAFLYNSAISMGMSVHNTYNTYFSRQLLELISKYSFCQIIVKGSFSQYIHLKKLYRPITDIDLTSQNSFDDVYDILKYAVNPNNNDSQILFKINEQKKYSEAGTISLSITCSIGTIKHVIFVDLRCNNNQMLELQYKLVIPLFKDDNEFYVNTPSYEEHLAEKLCIIAERAKKHKERKLCSRLKDFYDVYQLHGGKYDFSKLTIYFEKMLRISGIISMEELTTEHLNLDFINNNKKLWDIVQKKHDFLDKNVDLNLVVAYSKAVLSEQIQRARCLANKDNCY